MPDSKPAAPGQSDGRARTRTSAERAEDHVAAERLAADLIPALVAKLTTSGLAELEVREGSWRVRLRRPLELIGGRRSTDRHVRLHGLLTPGHASPGAGRAPGSAAAPGGTGSPLAATGSGRDMSRVDADPQRPVASSPAVGIFRPLAGISGTRVRSGDRLGAVDMLGIPQEVVSPADGIVGAVLAEAGEAVEYGQGLIAIEATPPPGAERP